MKVYLVCESYCFGYEDHGWEIKKSFFAEDAANSYCMELECKNSDTQVEYYIETIEVH